eukprot:5373608-Pyramimonas_sp.AAC.1
MQFIVEVTAAPRTTLHKALCRCPYNERYSGHAGLRMCDHALGHSSRGKKTHVGVPPSFD